MISYRLIKAVRDTRPWSESIGEVVDCLYAAVIPKPYRQMGVVFIPKPGCDLIVVKK